MSSAGVRSRPYARAEAPASAANPDALDASPDAVGKRFRDARERPSQERVREDQVSGRSGQVNLVANDPVGYSRYVLKTVTVDTPKESDVDKCFRLGQAQLLIKRCHVSRRDRVVGHVEDRSDSPVCRGLGSGGEVG